MPPPPTPKLLPLESNMTDELVPDDSASKKKPRLDGTIVKGFALIEHLAASDQPLGVSAIAQNLGWQKSNAHRLLTTLKALGYVRQDPVTSRYELSLKTWELGMKVVGRSVIKRCALPFIRNLNQQFKETVNLSILVGDEILYLDSMLSPFPLRPTASPGARVPAIFTASGKCLLAYWPDAETIARRIIETHPEGEKIRLEELLDELESIRKRGYAISLSGWRLNVNSVAVPIQNRNGFSVAAIGISGPAERMDTERILAMAPALMNAASEIAEASGGEPQLSR